MRDPFFVLKRGADGARTRPGRACAAGVQRRVGWSSRRGGPPVEGRNREDQTGRCKPEGRSSCVRAPDPVGRDGRRRTARPTELGLTTAAHARPGSSVEWGSWRHHQRWRRSKTGGRKPAGRRGPADSGSALALRAAMTCRRAVLFSFRFAAVEWSSPRSPGSARTAENGAV
jgi:hypothetical protein